MERSVLEDVGGRYVVKAKEMYWRLIDCAEPLGEVYLGEAGNPSRHVSEQTRFLRLGDEVLVQTGRLIRNGSGKYGGEVVIVPAAAVIVGAWLPAHEGRQLSEVLVEGVEYGYALRPLAELL